ncbi:MAG: hypothetical protein FJ083_02960 [Cyanobacteria bacterium K_Offshore_surface_m2_239]|nr:hypothetical protein [Cyanobacteria bacterium K_Offshore_surface_m2_239]
MHASDEAKALSHASPAYRPEIDGLRAVAVLAVLIHHFDPAWLPGGFLGVDLFFVISGYVVTASLARRQERHWREMLAGFYTRRFRRLIPALLVMVLVTAIAFTAFVSRSDATYGPIMGTGLTSLIGASNLYLLRTGTDYFNFSTQFNPFLHTWSLGVEEQFYLLWPVLVLLTGVGFRGAGTRALRLLLLLTLILSLLSFALYWRLSTSSATAAAFYLMPARFWELSAGALLVLVQALRPPATRPSASLLRPGPLSSWLCWGSITLVLVAFVVSNESAFVFKPVFVVATAALMAGLSRHSRLGRALSHPALLAIGMASYSLYLWHWPFIVLLRWTLGLRMLTLLPLTIAIALATWASYKLETRFRFGAIGASWFQQPLLLYPLASLVTGGVVVALSREGGPPLYLGDPATDPQTFAVTPARCAAPPSTPSAASWSPRPQWRPASPPTPVWCAATRNNPPSSWRATASPTPCSPCWSGSTPPRASTSAFSAGVGVPFPALNPGPPTAICCPATGPARPMPECGRPLSCPKSARGISCSWSRTCMCRGPAPRRTSRPPSRAWPRPWNADGRG